MKKITLIFTVLIVGNFTFGQSTKDNDKFSSFGIRVGYSVVQHLEPQIYGQNMTTQQQSVVSGALSGIETMNGVDLKAHYFFKNNLGVYLNLGFANSSNSIDYENEGEPFIQYQTDADFINSSLGIASRFQFDKVPANIIVGLNIGYYGYNIRYSNTANGEGQWYDGDYPILKVGIEALIQYRIFKGLSLFSELNYSTQFSVDGDNLTLEYTSDSGDFSNIVYKSPSMAALRISFGIGYDF